MQNTISVKSNMINKLLAKKQEFADLNRIYKLLIEHMKDEKKNRISAMRTTVIYNLKQLIHSYQLMNEHEDLYSIAAVSGRAMQSVLDFQVLSGINMSKICDKLNRINNYTKSANHNKQLAANALTVFRLTKGNDK